MMATIWWCSCLCCCLVLSLSLHFDIYVNFSCHRPSTLNMHCTVHKHFNSIWKRPQIRGVISMNVPGNAEICLQYTWECISNNSGITSNQHQHTGVTTAPPQSPSEEEQQKQRFTKHQLRILCSLQDKIQLNKNNKSACCCCCRCGSNLIYTAVLTKIWACTCTPLDDFRVSE